MSEIKTTGTWLDDGRTIERRTQDVEPILEHAKALRSVGEVGSNEMRHAARIPYVVIEQYLATHGIDLHEFHTNPVHVRRMLNDSALAGFRIWQGKV